MNLGLRVTGRRPDGYHLLESLFVPLDLCDLVELELRDAPGVALEVGGDIPTPDDPSNLAWRAAEVFLAEPGAQGGVALRLEKRIPSPGGLGGGSSDAGAVLRGLRELQPGAVAHARLVQLALGLGADVPFFLDPRPALVEGIGERIQPVSGLPGLWLALAHPEQPLPTPEVFACFERASEPSDSLTAPGSRPTIRRLLALRGRDARTEVLDGLDAAGWRELLANDLEPSATRLCPEVAEMREEFEANQALAVGMSGSGPSVYGVFRGEEAARGAADRVAERTGARTWVARTTR